jgi:hypothetical protein
MLHGPYVHLAKAKPIHRDKPILSSAMLHKDYDRKGIVEKHILVMVLKGLGAKTN